MFSPMLYQERVLAGLCTHCGQPLDIPGRRRCLKCLKAARLAMSKIIARRIAQGICVTCGGEVITDYSRMCNRCAKEARRRNRMYKCCGGWKPSSRRGRPPMV